MSHPEKVISHSEALTATLSNTGKLKRRLSSTSTLSEFEDAVREASKQVKTMQMRDIEQEDPQQMQAMVKRVSTILGEDVYLVEGEDSDKHWLVDSRPFMVVVYLAILMNTVQLGLCTRTQGDGISLGKAGADTCEAVDQVFLWGFLLEALIKIWAHRCQYFRSWWNWFDLTILLVGFTDLAVRSGLQLSSLRTLRILRMFRLLRVMRLFAELWVVLEGLFSSLKPTLWIMALLAMMLYVFSIVCVDTIGSVGEEVYPGHTIDDRKIVASSMVKGFNNYVYFGTIPRSMYTLFNVVIGAEWPEIGRAIWERQPVIFCFFAVFIGSTMFGLMNVLIGVIVDNTKVAQERLTAEQEAKSRSTKARCITKLCRFAFSIDSDQDGEVSLDDWQKEVEQEADALQPIMELLDLPHGFDAKELFHLFNMNGGETISSCEMVLQAYRLIYGSEFQQQCGLIAGINHLRADVAKILRKQTDMQRDVDALKKDVTSLVGGGGGGAVPPVRGMPVSSVAPTSLGGTQGSVACCHDINEYETLKRQLEEVVNNSHDLLHRLDEPSTGASMRSAATTMVDRPPVSGRQLLLPAIDTPPVLDLDVSAAFNSACTLRNLAYDSSPLPQDCNPAPCLPNMCIDGDLRDGSRSSSDKSRRGARPPAPPGPPRRIRGHAQGPGDGASPSSGTVGIHAGAGGAPAGAVIIETGDDASPSLQSVHPWRT